MVYLSKTVCGIFHPVSFLLNFIIAFNKKHGSLSVTRHNSFQNKNNAKGAHSFAPTPLIFMLQQEV